MTPTNLLFIVLLQIGRVFGNPEGPPSQACISQMPDHPGSPQPDESTPYAITLNPETYAAGSDITVTVHSTTSSATTFKGFFVQARRVGSSAPIGTFILLDTAMNNIHTQPLDCSGTNTAWGHNSNIDKTTQSVTWKAPGDSQGDVEFRAAFVQTYESYWRPEAVTTIASYMAGNWNLWSDWGPCSSTCDGFRTRSRTCSVSSCVGDSVAVDTCSSCPTMPTEEPNTLQWNPWSSWNPCSCSSSQRSRTRICNDPGNTGDQCPGNNSESEDCTPSNDCNSGDPNPTTTATTTTKKSTGLSTGQIVGIVFGVLAAISLIVSLTWVCCCCFCMRNRGQMGMSPPPPGRRESVPMQPMGLPSMNSRRDGSMIGGRSTAGSIVGSESGRWLPERTRGFGGLQTQRYY